MTASTGGARPSPGRATAARATMAALAGSADVFETFFDQARVGLALADLSTLYVRVNDTYAELVGRRPEDLIGVPFAEVLHPEDREHDEQRIADLLAGQEPPDLGDQRYVARDGSVRFVMHGVTVVRDDTGAPSWFAVSAQDITERRRAEQRLREVHDQLSERAVRDPLTQLANRDLLEQRLHAQLGRDARTGESTAVLFLDLDGFKAVNDEHGHSVGDAVLRLVAQRLEGAVRPADTVARMGGDEFVVLVGSAHPEGLAVLVRRLGEAVAEPLQVGGASVRVGVSIGVAVSEAGTASLSGLLEQADQAMYAEKRRRLPQA